LKNLYLKNKDIFTDLVSLYITHFANYLIPLILIPYVTRKIGVGGWGQIAIITAWSQLAVMFIEYAYHLSAQREVAENRDNKEKVEEIIKGVVSAKLILSMLVAPVFLLINSLIIKISFTLLSLAILFSLIQAFSFTWILRGIGKTALSAYLEFFSKILSLILILIFLNTPQDIEIYFISLIIGSVVNIFISIFYLHKKYSIKISFNVGLESIIKGFNVFKINLAGNISSLTPVLLTGHVLGNESAGLYSAADKIARMMGSFMDPIRHAFYPRISYAVANDKKNAKRNLWILLKFILVIGVTLAVITYMLSGWILILVYGTDFTNAKNILQILSLLPILIGLENVFVILWMLPYRQEKILIKIQLMTYFILVTASLSLFHTLGNEAPAVAVIVSQFLLVICAMKITLAVQK
jgi:PST family polysaccharide transporter